ncbi:MAG: hypothetical protein JWO09_1979 [Bacteroidetes bacterium]|nr:hypothetical protein [Bacteroidota bacterium]
MRAGSIPLWRGVRGVFFTFHIFAIKNNMKQSALIRYILPPAVITILAGIFLFSQVSLHGKAGAVLIGVAVLAAINILLYFIFQFSTRTFLKNDLVSAFICLAGAFFISGQAFRIMHWPAVAFQLYTACALLVCAIAAFLIKKRSML